MNADNAVAAFKELAAEALRYSYGGEQPAVDHLTLTLSAGERVAASGSFKLREDVLVAVVDQPALAVSSSR